MEQNRAINAYTCDKCGQRIVTINAEDGVTPMFVACRATPGCGGKMASAFYRVNEHVIPEWEWYRPVGAELRKLKGDMRRHVELGGLLLRKLAQTGGTDGQV